jgi:hypothetical protein
VGRPVCAAPLRWLRALTLAAAALLAGSLAHLGADGTLPGPVALTGLLAVATAVTAALLRHAASTRRVLALLVGGQAAIHLALTAASGHHEDGPPEPALTGPALWLHHLSEDLTWDHAAMAVAHAAAAAAVGLWLAHGERAVWRLVAIAGQAVVAVVRPLPLPRVLGTPRVVPLTETLLPPTLPAAARSVRRRGPPAASTATP